MSSRLLLLVGPAFGWVACAGLIWLEDDWVAGIIPGVLAVWWSVGAWKNYKQFFRDDDGKADEQPRTF